MDGKDIALIKALGGSGSGGSVTVDSELSDTSENPVQNKVVTATLDAKLDVYAVTFTLNSMTGETSVDKTFDEIKTAYSSGMFVLAKYVVSFGDMNIIRGFSATCNYFPADNMIFFTLAFGELGHDERNGVLIGSISIDSNNNVVIQDGDSVIDGLISVGGLIILNSSTHGSTKKFKITVDDSGVISATEV